MTGGPQRSDGQHNRERILEVALVELPRSADVPLSTIAKKAGVGQGTLYRDFPNREALVLEAYQHAAGGRHDGRGGAVGVLDGVRADRVPARRQP